MAWDFVGLVRRINEYSIVDNAACVDFSMRYPTFPQNRLGCVTYLPNPKTAQLTVLCRGLSKRQQNEKAKHSMRKRGNIV